MEKGIFTEYPAKSTMSITNTDENGESYVDGNYRVQGDFLVLTISEVSQSDIQYFTGIFKEVDGRWVSIFNDELVPGQLEQITDLNANGDYETIIDEYQGNSAGFESYQVFYARTDNAYLEKIDTISRRWFPGNAFYGVRTTITIVPDGEHEMIMADTQVTTENQTDSSFPPSIVRTVSMYSWQSPNLVKVSEETVQPQSPVDLVLAQSELDRLMEGFEKQTKLLELTYNSGSDMEASTVKYLFDENYGIRYRKLEKSAEGGYEELSLTEYENKNARRCLRTLQEFSDFRAFCFFQDDVLKWTSIELESYVKEGLGYYKYKASDDELPENALRDNMTDSFDFGNDRHMITISANATRFNLVEGRYEFYLRRDSVQSEYGGKSLVYEVYRVDSLLFVNTFLKK